MSSTTQNIIRLVREHTGLTESQATITVGPTSIIIDMIGILSGVQYTWIPNWNPQNPQFIVSVDTVNFDIFEENRMFNASDDPLFEIYNAMVDLYNESIDD